MILDLHCKMHWYAGAVKHGRKLHGVEEIAAAGKGATRIRGRTLGIIGLGKLFQQKMYWPYTRGLTSMTGLGHIL